jgi:endonuclease/exonuclease/phosphatase family metal-dependent hydrolase
LRWAASSDVDHVLCGDLVEVRAATVARLERGLLSDHAPLAVTLAI